MRGILLFCAALAAAGWLFAGDEADDQVDRGPVRKVEPAGSADRTSGYQVTGVNWSTDREAPAYVPPHQRRVLADAPRRQADEDARALDARTMLEASATAARVRPGRVIADPEPEQDPEEVAIE